MSRLVTVLGVGAGNGIGFAQSSWKDGHEMQRLSVTTWPFGWRL